MAQKKAVENSFCWIADEQTIHETAGYGSNRKSVYDALDEQNRRVRLVKDYKPDVEKAAAGTKDGEKANLLSAYDGLQTVATKREGCLEDISKIAGLEEFFNSLSAEFAQTATSLVTNGSKEEFDEKSLKAGGEGIARAAQGCILAVRTNWAWISQLVKCTDIHLQHVTQYHEFFHEIKEYEHWMPVEINTAQKLISHDNYKGDTENISKLLLDLKEVLTIFLHWQGKVDNLFERSKKIIPVHLRTNKLEHYRPISALCDYKTKEITIQQGEELTLLNNEQPQSWVIRNIHTKQANVPSVICLIPGPDPNALKVAMNLRLQLLEIWTTNVKRIGLNLIRFLLLVLRDWNEDEIKMLKAIPYVQKQEITRTLDFIESSLAPYWSEHDDFKRLHVKIETLKEIFKQEGDPKDRDSAKSEALVVQLGLVDELMKRYQDFLRYWETYKVLTETVKHGEHMLVLENWEELMFLQTSELLKKMHSGGFSSFGNGADYMYGMSNGVDSTDFEEIEETIEKTSSEMVSGAANGFEDEEEMMTASSSVTEVAQADQLTRSEQEERKKFVITGVVDPRNGEEVSMQQAVMLGIINNDDGTYVNPETGLKVPIPVAMNEGNIKVEFVSKRMGTMKQQDIGLITIKTQREARPYTVKSAIDAKTDEKLSVDDAMKKGILDQKNGIYKNTMNDKDMSLADAIDSGLLIVEFDKDANVAEPEVETKTYAIHKVVNQRTKEKVPFSTAVRLGLINKETGAYYHNINRESIYVGDAIKKGFVKATVVTDPTSLDIDPENKIVAKRVELIKKKMISPMKAMVAFKAAGAARSEKNNNNNGK